METLIVLGVIAVIVATHRIREAYRHPINVRHAAATNSGRHGGWWTGRHRDAALITTSAVVLLGVARVGWWLR